MSDTFDQIPMADQHGRAIANRFAQQVTLAFTKEQDNEAMQSLPRDVQFQVFTLGVLTGVLSIWIRAAGQKHFDTCVETVVAYVPSAAALALAALDAAERGGAQPQ
jgi:hypothetical protein